MAEDKDHEVALKSLQKAVTLTKQAYGGEDLQLARALELMGKVNTMRKDYPQALENLSQAWEIREHLWPGWFVRILRAEGGVSKDEFPVGWS